MMEKCYLCGDYSRNTEKSGISKFLKDTCLDDIMLYDNGAFYVMPALGCIIPGYIVLISCSHTNCICEMSDTDLKDIGRLFYSMQKIMKSHTSGEIVMFEHGSTPSDHGGASIDHAHLHMAPFQSFNALRRRLKDCYSEISFNHLQEIKFAQNRDLPYVFISNGTDYFYYPTPIIESQFIRKILAEQWGKSDLWNWKEHTFRENMDDTYKMLYGYL